MRTKRLPQEMPGGGILRAFARGQAKNEPKNEQGAAKVALDRKQELMRIAGVVFLGAAVGAVGAVGGAVGQETAKWVAPRARRAPRATEIDHFESACSSDELANMRKEFRHETDRELTPAEAARACALIRDRGAPSDTVLAWKWSRNGRPYKSGGDKGTHVPSVLSVAGTRFVRRLGTCDYEGCKSGSQCWTLAGELCYRHLPEVVPVRIDKTPMSVRYVDAEGCATCASRCIARIHTILAGEASADVPFFARHLDREERVASHAQHVLCDVGRPCTVHTTSVELKTSFIAGSGYMNAIVNDGEEIQVREMDKGTHAIVRTFAEIGNFGRLPRFAQVFGFGDERDTTTHTEVGGGESGSVLVTPLGRHQVGVFRTYTLTELRDQDTIAKLAADGSPVRLVACGPRGELLDESQNPARVAVSEWVAENAPQVPAALLYRAYHCKPETALIDEKRVGVHLRCPVIVNSEVALATLVVAHVPESGETRRDALELAYTAAALIAIAQPAQKLDLSVCLFRPFTELYTEAEATWWSQKHNYDKVNDDARTLVAVTEAISNDPAAFAAARVPIRPVGHAYQTVQNLRDSIGKEANFLRFERTEKEKEESERRVQELVDQYAKQALTDLILKHDDTNEVAAAKRRSLLGRVETAAIDVSNGPILVVALTTLREAWPISVPAGHSLLVIPDTRSDDENRVLHNLRIGALAREPTLDVGVATQHRGGFIYAHKITVSGAETTVELSLNKRGADEFGVKLGHRKIGAVLSEACVFRDEDQWKRENASPGGAVYVAREGTSAPAPRALRRMWYEWTQNAKGASGVVRSVAQWALGEKSISPDSLDEWPSASHDVDRLDFSPNARRRYGFVAVYVSRSEDLEALAGVLLRILADGGVFVIELAPTCKARSAQPLVWDLSAIVSCAGLASRQWGYLSGHHMERVVLYGTLRTSRVPGMVSADRDIYDKSTENAYEKALWSIVVTQESLGGEVMQRVHFSTTVVVFATWDPTNTPSGEVVAYVGPAFPAEPNESQNRVVVTRGGTVTWVAGSRRFVVRYDGSAVTLSEPAAPNGEARTTSVTSPVTIVEGEIHGGRFGARRYV